MSDSEHTKHKKDIATSIGAGVGAVAGAAVAYDNASAELINSVVDHSYDVGMVEQFNAAGTQVKKAEIVKQYDTMMKDVDTVLTSEKYKKIAPRVAPEPVATVISPDSRSGMKGLRHLTEDNSVSEVVFHKVGNHTYDLHVKLSPEALKKAGEDAALHEGGYVIHGVKRPKYGVIPELENGRAAISLKQFNKLEGTWYDAVFDAAQDMGKGMAPVVEKAKAEEELLLCAKSFRKAAPWDWSLKRISSEAKLSIVGWALAGAVVGGMVARSFIGASHTARIEQKQAAAADQVFLER